MIQSPSLAANSLFVISIVPCRKGRFAQPQHSLLTPRTAAMGVPMETRYLAADIYMLNMSCVFLTDAISPSSVAIETECIWSAL